MPPEQTSQAADRAELNKTEEENKMDTDFVQDYALDIDNADSFINAPMSKYIHPALADYDHEKIIEVNNKEDLKPVKDAYWAEARNHVDPQTHKVMPFTLPIHLIFTVSTKETLKDVLAWFIEMRWKVSTLEIRFANNVIDVFDTLIDLRTDLNAHNRVILTSAGEAPVDISTFHILASADVLQISNMTCQNCDALSIKIEAKVGRLFEAKKLSISGTQYVKSNLEFLIKTQMLVSTFEENDKSADMIFENCYFADHKLHKIISVGYGFDHVYLKNVGFYNNNKMYFGLPAQKSLKLDHVIASEGSVQINLSGKTPEIEQNDCILPEGVIK